MTAKNKYQKINQEIGEEMKGKLIKKRTDITKLNKTDMLICMRFRPSIHDLMDINKYAPNLRYIILTSSSSAAIMGASTKEYMKEKEIKLVISKNKSDIKMDELQSIDVEISTLESE